jgi:pseudouridine kinase
VLVSSVGRDAAGESVLLHTAAAGVVLDYIHRTECPTGTYVALLDNHGELVAAVSDMAATDELAAQHLHDVGRVIATAELLVLDGNLPSAVVQAALDSAAAAGVRAIVEPVSAPKARRLVQHLTADRPVYAITPNRDELAAMTGLPTDTVQQVEAAAEALHRRGVRLVWVRLGERGSLMSEETAGGAISRTHLPALPTHVRDVTGAGDAMLAAFCHALVLGHPPAAAARYGHAAAALTIASLSTVRADLTVRLLQSELDRNGPTSDMTVPAAAPTSTNNQLKANQCTAEGDL